MAESILAFGIAANVIQFIDFGCKILSTGYQLHKSGDLKENDYLADISCDLSKVSNDLDHVLLRSAFTAASSQNELDLQNLAARSKEVCIELSETLDKLKLKGPPRVLKTFRVALMNVWSESKIDKLQKRLDGFRQELVVRILVSLR